MNFLPQQKKIPDLIAEYGTDIEKKFQKAVSDTVEFVNTHQDYRYSVSRNPTELGFHCGRAKGAIG